MQASDFQDGETGDAPESASMQWAIRWGGALLCALMAALSAAISYRFGLLLGAEVGLPQSVALAGVAADGLKLVSPTLALSFWRKSKLLAVCAALIGAGCLVLSLFASTGVAGAALGRENSAITGLAAALGLNASSLLLLAPLLLALLVEAGAMLGAALLAFWLTSDARGAEADEFFELSFEEEKTNRASSAQETPQAPTVQISDASSKPVAKPKEAEIPPQRSEPPQKPQAARRGEQPFEDRTPEPAEQNPEPEAPQGEVSRAARSARSPWSLFRRKPKARPYGEGTAPPLDEPQPSRPEAKPEQPRPTRHHGRDLHSRVKGLTDKLEREARAKREKDAGGRADRKDSA